MWTGLRKIGFLLLLLFCSSALWADYVLSDSDTISLNTIINNCLGSTGNLSTLTQNSIAISTDSEKIIYSLAGTLQNQKNLLIQSEQDLLKQKELLNQLSINSLWIAGGCVVGGIVIGILIRGAFK